MPLSRKTKRDSTATANHFLAFMMALLKCLRGLCLLPSHTQNSRERHSPELRRTNCQSGDWRSQVSNGFIFAATVLSRHSLLCFLLFFLFSLIPFYLHLHLIQLLSFILIH